MIWVLTRKQHTDPNQGTPQPENDGSTGLHARGIAELSRLFVTGTLSEAAWRVVCLGATAAGQQGDDAPATPESAIQDTVLTEWSRLSLDEQRRWISDALRHVIVNKATRRGPQFDPDRVHLQWR